MSESDYAANRAELQPGETRLSCPCGESITTTNPYEADAWADTHECEYTQRDDPPATADDWEKS